MVGAETSAGFSLIQASGVREQVLRKDVKEVRASGLSLMPESLEAFSEQGGRTQMRRSWSVGRTLRTPG